MYICGIYEPCFAIVDSCINLRCDYEVYVIMCLNDILVNLNTLL